MNPDLDDTVPTHLPVPDLSAWRLSDVPRAQRNLDSIRQNLVTTRYCELFHHLARILPRCPDPDMALNNLERLLSRSSAHDYLPIFLDFRGRSFETLVQLLSTSQFFSDSLVIHPDFLELLRPPQRRHPSIQELFNQLQEQVENAYEASAILRAFRLYRQRQLIRIGTNDVIRNRPLEEITRDLSRVADIALEVAYRHSFQKIAERFGVPQTVTGQPASAVILAFGKLGGEELNYSSDIDLMIVYDFEGQTSGQRTSISNSEFFSRVVSEVVRLLADFTEDGQAYRVDLRLRPEGARGALAKSFASTMSYYDHHGRTWERQAMIKLRPVAGDKALGHELLRQLEPFVYRKYLGVAEINEIKALKRRIERKTSEAGLSERDVKTGRGGIRDIEFTIQFLQLLNGGQLAEVRQRSTLIALEALEAAGCLTDQEYRCLDDSYRFLRKTEHRLQLLFDWQTHQLPESHTELEKLARRMGYTARVTPKVEPSSPSPSALQPQSRSLLDETTTLPMLDPRDLLVEPLDQFLHDYHEKTKLNRTVLDFLLHQTFIDSDEGAEPESDLILATDIEPKTIEEVLGRYPFRDCLAAYHHLMQLAQENVPFLSTRRCRHFFASIAPQLIRAIADTPDPDLALCNLEKVTCSLGAKSVLWELFRFNPPSLKFYVDLCSNSSFLSELLMTNPGMIDELLDSLVLNQPRGFHDLQYELRELCRNATDLEPILHSFQDKELLRIGVRDILGKDRIQATTMALSELAETILDQVILSLEPMLVERLGTPMLANGQPCRSAWIALGKLGGQEMSYHSDLDLLIIYEDDGFTDRRGVACSIGVITNFDYFSELARRVTHLLSQVGPLGRLYAVDLRLRPAGAAGNLVLSLGEFSRYFSEGCGQLWERQILTRARVIHGEPSFHPSVRSTLEAIVYGIPWQTEHLHALLSMLERVHATSSPRSLKRAPGRMMDIEFLVQSLLFQHGAEHPEIRQSNLWEALEGLARTKILTHDAFEALYAAYSFFRLVESRLRLMTNRAMTEYPDDPSELEKLARRLAFESSEPRYRHHAFLRELEQHTNVVQWWFRQLTANTS